MENQEFLTEQGHVDFIRKAAVEYSISRATSFKDECWVLFQNLLSGRLKARALIKECQRIFMKFISKVQPEIEAAHVLGELSMCERVYYEVLKMKEEEVDKDMMTGMLQILMVHFHSETIDKCGLHESLKVDLETILKRDGFYDKYEETFDGYRRLPES